MYTQLIWQIRSWQAEKKIVACRRLQSSASQRLRIGGRQTGLDYITISLISKCCERWNRLIINDNASFGRTRFRWRLIFELISIQINSYNLFIRILILWQIVAHATCSLLAWNPHKHILIEKMQSCLGFSFRSQHLWILFLCMRSDCESLTSAGCFKFRCNWRSSRNIYLRS